MFLGLLRWKLRDILSVFLCTIHLLVSLPLSTCILSVPDEGMVLRVLNERYDAALDAWIFALAPLPEHVLSFVHTCNTMAESHTSCLFPGTPLHMTCADVKILLQNEAWSLVHSQYDTQNPDAWQRECLLSDYLQHNSNFIHIAYPPEIRILRNASMLAEHAYHYGNNVYEMELRLMTMNYISTIFIPKFAVYKLNLTVPADLLQTVHVEHICAARGFVAPPKSVLQLVSSEIADTLQSGFSDNLVSSCVWKCDASHVRQPFNRPPLLKSEWGNATLIRSLTFSPMCFPLLSQFIGVQLKAMVYIDTTLSYTLFAQAFYDTLDVVSVHVAEALRIIEIGNPLVLIKHHNSVYDNIAFLTLMQQHAVRQHSMQTLETFFITPSETVSRRRLLQTGETVETSVYGIQASQLDILVMSDNLYTEPSSTIVAIQESVDASLQEYQFPEEIVIESISNVEVISFTRLAKLNNVNNVLDEATHGKMAWQRIFLFAIEGVCLAGMLWYYVFQRPRNLKRSSNINNNGNV